MADFEMVQPSAWPVRVEAVMNEGFDSLTYLTAVDDLGRANQFRVLAWFDDITTSARRYLGVAVDRFDPHLPTISHLSPAAYWLERQVHDFFGISFDGGDNTALLNHDGGAPLRKDYLLEPRQTRRWPGALEPGESAASPSRRRLNAPGVPDAEIAADASASPELIALSAAGMRLRRPR